MASSIARGYLYAVKTVIYRGPARRALRKLPTEISTRIAAKIQAYADSGAGDVKPLVGREGSRLRVGDHRVMFIERADSIEVVALGHRSDVYR